jgi:hypothetical protein
MVQWIVVGVLEYKEVKATGKVSINSEFLGIKKVGVNVKK